MRRWRSSRYAGASTRHQPPLAPGIWPAEALRYPLRALSPWPAAAALLAAALVALTGCASNQASSAPRPSAAPSPPVVKDGHLTPVSYTHLTLPTIYSV